jgi:transposase
MRKISEVLRLKAANLSIREIAASTGCARTTVHEYLVRAAGAGISWPLTAELDDEAIEAKLFPPESAERAAGRPVPDWAEVHRELKRRHVTLQLLWLEWREDHPEGWAYTQFTRHYKDWLGSQDVVMRLSYRPGEKMFVDFSGDTMDLVDPESGEVSKAEVFVAVLGCSGLLYVEAARGQDLGSWLLAHAHAYEYYGGAPEATVPDNLKSAVTKACYYDPEVNASYAELARHYGTAVLPTRTYRPRDKAWATDCTS